MISIQRTLMCWLQELLWSKSRCVIVFKIVVSFGSLQELVNSLEKKTKLELPDNLTDNELVNKLAEENEKLKVNIT